MTTPSIPPAPSHDTLGSWAPKVKKTIKLPRSVVAAGGAVPLLIHSRRRLALPLWLFLVAVAHPQGAAVNLRQFRNFGRCLGLDSSRDGSAVRSTLTRAIATLEAARLVRITDRAHKNFTLELRALDGSGDPYAMPSHGTRVIEIPGEMFHNMWHVVLTPAQLGCLLISFAEAAWQYNKVGRNQWQKRRREIAKDYGIAESTWSEGKEELYRLGLLEWDLVVLPWDEATMTTPVLDRYTTHPETLVLAPAAAPRYEPIVRPFTVPASGSRPALRLQHRSRRQVLADGTTQPSDVVLPLRSTGGPA